MKAEVAKYFTENVEPILYMLINFGIVYQVIKEKHLTNNINNKRTTGFCKDYR